MTMYLKKRLEQCWLFEVKRSRKRIKRGNSNELRRTALIEKVIKNWHLHLKGQFPGGLDELLADDVQFFSPIVFTPQKGKDITKLYLGAAGNTFRCGARRPRRVPGAVCRRKCRPACADNGSRRDSLWANRWERAVRPPG